MIDFHDAFERQIETRRDLAEVVRVRGNFGAEGFRGVEPELAIFEARREFQIPFPNFLDFP